MKIDKVLVFDSEKPDGFIEKLTAELGIKKGDKVEIVTPQFDRTDGKAILYFPNSVEEFNALKSMSKEMLLKLGLLMWNGHEDKKTWIHWMYPYQWYDFIPQHYMVTDIFEVDEPFIKGVTDDDRRFGCLPYGFIQKNNQ